MGDTVPADMRLFEAMNLACEESQLTGESTPVEKSSDYGPDPSSYEAAKATEADVGIGDRINMAYATTVVQKGRARGIVTHTGMTTEVGKIAASASSKSRKAGRSMNYKKYGKRQTVVGFTMRVYDAVGRYLGLTEGTPLQRKLASLAYILFFCSIVLALVVFAVNKFKITNQVTIYAVSIGIAIIPESLVAVLTITMVVAVTVMRKSNVVIRDLSALEALGGVTNICSDKTGTLTEGAMIVRQAWIPGDDLYTVHNANNPADPTRGRVVREAVDDDSQGQLTGASETEEQVTMTNQLYSFLIGGALCNLATVRFDEGEGEWKTTGEPTEIALQVFSHRFDLGKKALQRAGWHQLAEFPFDSDIKRMSVIYGAPGNGPWPLAEEKNSVVFTKGAVERVLDLCSHVGVGGSHATMTPEIRDQVLSQMTKLASQGQRVLAMAYKVWDGQFIPDKREDEAHGIALRAEVEQGLTLIGLAGIYDPPRQETKMSILECSNAGIKVHMLTGDHPETAAAIAKEVGIIPKNAGVLPRRVARSIVQKATDFDKMSDEEIDALEELPLVIARCAPSTKTRMIEALRRRGAFMAMTGDGVNDAPSLSRADVGIAMGSGSDVAKSAAKIVLTDDKFNSIVAAIREGRRMFDNIQKFVLHLLTSNVGEIILLIAGLGFTDASGMSVFPISPLQIIWINMVTSSFPAFGLGREQAAPDVMARRPQSKRRGVFTNQLIVDMIVYGIIMGGCSLATFSIIVYGANGGDLGDGCNNEYSEACEAVFRARAATFAVLTLLILVSAWEFKSLRRSMFRLRPTGEGRKRLGFVQDILDNRFLFWSLFFGGLSIYPIIYIPYVNTTFFKHVGITWEWALVFSLVLVFVLGVEMWKLAKRTLHLFEDAPVPHGRWDQGRENRFGGGPSTAGFMTWPSFTASFAKESFGSIMSTGRRRSKSVVSGEDPNSPLSPDTLPEPTIDGRPER